MKCSDCDKPSVFKCSCMQPFICDDHTQLHLQNQNHVYEKLKIEYKEPKLGQFKSKILNNMQKINKVQSELRSKTKDIIKFIEKHSQTALKKLDDINKTFQQLLNRSRFCRSEMPGINQIETMDLSVPSIEFDDIENEVKKIFSQNLFYYIEKQPNWEVPFLNTHVGGFWCGAVTNDYLTIVTGGYDSTIRVWDLGQKTQKFVLLGHNGFVRCITLNESSTRIISGSNDASVRIWSIKHRKEIKKLKGHKSGILSLCFVRTKSLIISGDSNNEVIIWNYKDFEKLKIINFSFSTRCMKFIEKNSIPDSVKNISLIAGIGKDIVFIKLNGFESEKSYHGHTNSVSCIVLSNDKNTMVSGSFDNSIIKWDLLGSNELVRFVGHTKAVQSLILTSDEKYIVSGSDDQSVRVWDFLTATSIFVSSEQTSFINSILRAGKHILSLSEDSSIGFTSIKKFKLKVCWFLKPFKYNSLNYISESKLVAFGSKNKAIIWNHATEEEKKLDLDHLHNVHYVEISKDGKFAISCSLGNGKNLIYSNLVKNKKIAELIGHKDSVICANFANDGNSLASGSLDKTVRIWDLKKLKQEFEFKGHTGLVNSVKFLSNNKLLASGGLDKYIIIWNLADNSKYAILSGHKQTIWRVFATDDEKFVISCDFFEGIRVWNVEKKQLEIAFSFQAKAENWLNKNRVPVELVKEFLKA